MNRRNFLSRIGIGGAATAASVVVPAVAEPKQPILRPKCPSCSTEMVWARNGDSTVLCPNALCPDYWKPVGVTVIGPQEERNRKRKEKEFKKTIKRFYSGTTREYREGIPLPEDLAKELEANLNKVDIPKEDKRGRP